MKECYLSNEVQNVKNYIKKGVYSKIVEKFETLTDIEVQCIVEKITGVPQAANSKKLCFNNLLKNYFNK